MLQTIMQLMAMQKLINKDGGDDSKFKDLLKYYFMFQRPGMQGGNNHQLLGLLYGLPGLETSSSFDMNDILKYLIGNPGGLGGFGGFGDMGELFDMGGSGDMAGLLGNPMLAGMLGGGNSLSSLLGIGDDDSTKDIMPFGSYLPFMGGSGLGDDMKDFLGGLPMGFPPMGDSGFPGLPMGFPPMGDSGLSGLMGGSSPLLSALLSMKSGGS